MCLDEQWPYCVVGGVKERGQSEKSCQVQLRQEAVKLVKMVGDDRWLRWVGGARGGVSNDEVLLCYNACIYLCIEQPNKGQWGHLVEK